MKKKLLFVILACSVVVFTSFFSVPATSNQSIDASHISNHNILNSKDIVYANSQNNSSWLPVTTPDWPLIVSTQKCLAFNVTSGVYHYREKINTVSGPQRVNVLSLNLTNQNFDVVPFLSHNRLYSNDETLTCMAQNDSHVVAGINGDYFFEIGKFSISHGQPAHMLIINGTMLQSPVQNNLGTLGIYSNGTMSINTENFIGNITDQNISRQYPLIAINVVIPPLAGSQGGDAIQTGGLVLATSAIGEPVPLGSNEDVAYLSDIAGKNYTYTVTSVADNVTTLPVLSNQQAALVGRNATADQFIDNLSAGNIINANWSLDPANNFEQAIGGGQLLDMNGEPAVSASSSSPVHAVTAVGLTKNGKHAFFVVFDGIQPSIGLGINHIELAEYMLQLGAYSAMLFDTGGSSEMITRLPGQTNVSVVNSPSDLSQRMLAEGIFICSKEVSPSQASHVVVNNGTPLTMLVNTSEPVSVYSLDSLCNPSSNFVSLSVSPSNLASVSGHQLTAGNAAGTGTLTATAFDGVSSHVPLYVVKDLNRLVVSPNDTELLNGVSQQFYVSAMTSVNGSMINFTIPSNAVSWSVSNPAIAKINSTGYLTALNGSGAVYVIAKVDGLNASSVAGIGYSPAVLSSMSDVSKWTAEQTEGTTGSISESTTVVRNSTSGPSMDVNYTIPAGSGVKQFLLFPSTAISVVQKSNAQKPIGIGIWIKGNGQGIWFAEGYSQANGVEAVYYPTYITFTGWKLVVVNLTPSLVLPLSTIFLDFLVIGPTTTLSGNLYLNDFETLFSSVPVTPAAYNAYPSNPNWISRVNSTSDFESGGFTFAAMGGALLAANNTNSTGSVVLKNALTQLQDLSSSVAPSFVQTVGNMVANGSKADLSYLDSIMNASTIKYHLAVGTGEISNGSNEENVNYAAVDGPTHYNYTFEGAEYIVLDDAHGGICSSNAYQDPLQNQYSWLVGVLNNDSYKDTFITMNIPPFDPHTDENHQFTNGYDAQQFVDLVDEFQATHTATHVVMLNGAVTGYEETYMISNLNGLSGSVLDFLVSDLASTNDMQPLCGGFYSYVIFHVSPNGTLQFAVEPVLSSISITNTISTKVKLYENQTMSFTAEGFSPSGNGVFSNLSVPPLSLNLNSFYAHMWSSNNTSVGSINANTGYFVAEHGGNTTVTIESGGVQTSIQVEVIQNVTPVTPPVPPTSPPPVNYALYYLIIGAILAVAVVGSAVYFFVIRKKKT